MPGIHENIWRSCQKATEALHEKRAQEALIQEAEKESVMVIDGINIAVALGIKRADAERAAQSTDAPTDTPENLAAFICRTSIRR